MLTVPPTRSTSDQRSASSSARRTPVTITNHTRVPQLSSCSHAAATMRPACSTVGGSGWGVGWRGFLATDAGLLLIQSHLTAAANVALITK